MKVAALALALSLVVAPASGTATRSSPTLFSLPSLLRIRVEATRDRVLVVHDVSLPRGEWQAGDVDLYVAFGAPGTPRAMDARLYALDPGAELRSDSPYEAILMDRASRRPSSAYALLGPPQMAGTVLHLREAAFRRATSSTGVARIQVRALLDLPAEDARTGREVVVRLGVWGRESLAIGRLEIASPDSAPWIARADAHLCGPEADSYPLAIAVLPTPAPRRQAPPFPGAPILAVRHPTDDLCIRFWTS